MTGLRSHLAFIKLNNILKKKSQIVFNVCMSETNTNRKFLKYFHSLKYAAIKIIQDLCICAEVYVYK